jgi:hypothetical protein
MQQVAIGEFPSLPHVRGIFDGPFSGDLILAPKPDRDAVIFLRRFSRQDLKSSGPGHHYDKYDRAHNHLPSASLSRMVMVAHGVISRLALLWCEISS